jgi:CxxC motif-containing protein (DUF1111 family)
MHTLRDNFLLGTRTGTMRHGVGSSSRRHSFAWLPLVVLALAMVCAGSAWRGAFAQAARSELDRKKNPNLGRELFLRQWVPGDERSHGGDGLGPVYNERSCAGCHHQGGTGGGGPADKNIEIISPASSGERQPTLPGFFYAFSYSFGVDGLQYRIGDLSSDANRVRRGAGPRLADLVQIHPGFRDAPSVVLHRYGNDADYRVWREWVLSPHGAIRFHSSQRNPTALFGAGLIDRIPEAAIEAAARRKHPGSPQVKGRVSRTGAGRVGRFGWKAQVATLHDFVLSAAAVELGLEVPGHAQAADPRTPPLDAPGMDLSAAELRALVAFVRSLPAPAAGERPDPRSERVVKAGKAVFRTIGCAECHVPKLDDIQNMYSDLLLHAMDPKLSDTGAYGAFLAAPRAQPANPAPAQALLRAGSATDPEWRTPPLWGLRETAPYLHDGRAATIEEAILLHGGEATAAAQNYRRLAPRDKAQLQLFLESL